MRQGNGTDLLGMNDPRSTSIGVIYVSPNDDRKSVLAAILTQEKLDRKQVVIVLPQQNKAFARPQDFDDLKTIKRKLQTQLIFVAPPGPGPAEFARQRRFTVYNSLEQFTQSLLGEELADAQPEPEEKKRRFFGARSKSLLPPAIQHDSTVDDDDALDDSSARLGAIGAGAGLLSSYNQSTPKPSTNQTANPPATPINTPNEADTSRHWDEYPTVPFAPNPSSPPPVVPVASTPTINQNNVTESAKPNIVDADDALDNDLDSPSGIIELKPSTPKPGMSKPKRAARSTINLNEPPATPVAAAFANSNKATPTKGGTGPLPIVAPIQTGNNPPRNNTANSNTNQRRRSPVRLLMLALVLILFTCVISGSVLAYNPKVLQQGFLQPISNVIPNVAPANMTVNITPDRKELNDNYVMLAVDTDKPAPNQLQVKLRTLEAAPPSQTKQVTGTGKTKTEAARATGSVILRNSSTSAQTIAPTVFTATNGVKFETTTSIRIPGRVGDTVGRITVPARAVVAGKSGNLPAGAYDGACCTSLVSAESTAFTGGQDPQDYTYVQQSDVDNAAQPMLDALSKQAKDDFNKKLQANEKLAGDVKCDATPSYNDETVGNKGRNIPSTEIKVSARCTGWAYDDKAAQDIAKTRLQKKVTDNYGEGYNLVGNIVTSVSNVNKQSQSVSMLVTARGVWVYQINDTRKQELIRAIAGKKVVDAEQILKAEKGIGNIKIESNGRDTLPTDEKQITLNIQTIPGASDTPGNGNTTPTPANTPASTPVTGTTPTVTGTQIVPPKPDK